MEQKYCHKIQLPCAEWKVLFTYPAKLLQTIYYFDYFQANALLKAGTSRGIRKTALWHQCHYFSLCLELQVLNVELKDFFFFFLCR